MKGLYMYFSALVPHSVSRSVYGFCPTTVSNPLLYVQTEWEANVKDAIIAYEIIANTQIETNIHQYV